MSVLVSQRSVPTFAVAGRALLVVLLMLCAAQGAWAVPDLWPEDRFCRGALSLDAGEGWTGIAEPSKAGELLAVEVPRPGWLALQAESEGAGSVWLDLASRPCGTGGEDFDFGFLDEGLLRITEPRTVYLRLGAVDGAILSSHGISLSTHLFPLRGSRPPEKDGEPGSDTEEDEDEVVPLLFPGESCFVNAYPALPRGARHKDGEPGSDTEEDEDEVVPLVFPGGKGRVATFGDAGKEAPTKDGEPGSDTEEDEDEVVPLTATGSGHVFTADRSPWPRRPATPGKDGEPGSDTEEDEDEVVPLWDGGGCLEPALARVALTPPRKDGEPGSDTEEDEDEVVPLRSSGFGIACRNTEPVNDFRFCAAHLGIDDRTTGRIDSRLGVDRDYFALTLDRVQRVTVTAAGVMDLRAALLDVNGRRLASSGDAGASELQAVLAPGHYYLRVEGRVVGDYELTLRRSEPGGVR